MKEPTVKISIFTDEINRESHARAIELAQEWAVDAVEVRLFPSGRFPAVDEAELHDFTKRIEDAGLAVSGVSPGFFKCGWDDPSVEPTFTDGLPLACEWAKRWNCDMVTCFGFIRDDSPAVPQQVIDLLGRMATTVQQHGCRLTLENEAVCWGDTGIEAGDMIRQIGADRIRLCWDPGNAGQAGSTRPYPDEYDRVKDLVSHVHLKSVDLATKAWALLGDGAIDWPGQLNALRDDGYDGYLVIETHLHIRPDAFRTIDDDLSDQESNTLHNLNYLRSCLANG